MPAKIDWEEVRFYVDQLPPKYRQAVELCDLQDTTRDGAAQEAGCSEGAMKVRLFRAHQELRLLCQEHLKTTKR